MDLIYFFLEAPSKPDPFFKGAFLFGRSGHNPLSANTTQPLPSSASSAAERLVIKVKTKQAHEASVLEASKKACKIRYRSAPDIM